MGDRVPLGGRPVADKKTHRPTSVWDSILPTSTLAVRFAAGPDNTALVSCYWMSLVLDGGVTNGCACVGNWEVVEVAANPLPHLADRFG